MDLLEGGELFDVIQSKGAFNLVGACKIMKQIFEGIDCMAKKNIVHRDLKPENLLLRYKDKNLDDNEVVICDFGLASKGSNECDPLMKKCGSPGYIAPEILRQDENEEEFEFYLDVKADIFSAGC